jgi:hypothetical protein
MVVVETVVVSKLMLAEFKVMSETVVAETAGAGAVIKEKVSE